MVNNPDYNKQYYENNKDRMLDNSKKQRQLNPDKFREYQQQYRELNKDKIKHTNKQWRNKNKDQRHEKYILNIDEEKAKYKAYYERKKQVIIECEICGHSYTFVNRSQHFKTKKHQQALNNIT